MKDFRYMAIVAVAAAGLALAGCSSSSGVSTSERDAAVEAEQAKTKALQDRIDALYAALGIDEDADPNATIADLQTKANELEQMVADKEMADAEADRMAAAKTGKDLFAALTADPLSLIGADGATLSSTGLTIDADGNPGIEANPVLKAGDSAGALGSWNGTHYASTTGTGASKVTNAAVVYNNRGPGRSQSFAAAEITVQPGTATTPHIPGYVTLENVSIPDNVHLARIMAAAFTHSGNQDHAYDAVNDAAFTTRGTYAGAPGEYRCTGECSSTNDGKGSPTTLAGTWHFKPDAGTSAMTHQPDAHYLYYGWWVSKDNDGLPTAASAFVREFGDVDGTGGTGDTASGETLTGSATYVGHAAGKFALDYSRNKVLDGASHGGHFTADAELNATFGPGATAGVTGTIDNFRLNDGSEDPGWSVKLNRSSAWATDGGITGPTAGAATVWSIDEVAAAASGTWSGTMYDEMPGNTDDTPPGDGSNIPTTVTGTFYSEYGASTSSVVGRMVGAFGANRVEQ